ncbi:MAG: hypothetical protein FWC50_06705 [Planctomycetaceae bacterium]|nr:hypothetical protein [Planctomycetaceae bacterium]
MTDILLAWQPIGKVTKFEEIQTHIGHEDRSSLTLGRSLLTNSYMSKILLYLKGRIFQEYVFQISQNLSQNPYFLTKQSEKNEPPENSLRAYPELVWKCYTQTGLKFQKRNTVSPATQGVCARPKAAAHTGYGIFPSKGATNRSEKNSRPIPNLP